MYNLTKEDLLFKATGGFQHSTLHPVTSQMEVVIEDVYAYATEF